MSTPGSSQAQSLWFLNTRVDLAPADLVAGLTVSEQWMPHGDAPPTHLHHDEDEIFHIREGVIRFRIGETERLAGAGDTLVAPRGVPHAFRVESAQGARAVVVTTGPGFGAMIRAFSRPAASTGLPDSEPMTPERAAALSEVCARNGIDILGPPLA